MSVLLVEVRIGNQRLCQQLSQSKLLLLEERHSEVLEVVVIEVIEVFNPSPYRHIQKLEVSVCFRVTVSRVEK